MKEIIRKRLHRKEEEERRGVKNRPRERLQGTEKGRPQKRTGKERLGTFLPPSPDGTESSRGEREKEKKKREATTQ